MTSIARRNGCGTRRQRRPTVGVVFGLALLATVAISGQARAEVKVENAVPVDSSALLEAALCVMKANPGQCVRQQAARVLTNWEDILNAKKMEMLAEADQEVTAKQQSRGLSDAEIARGKPSTLMEQIETGLTAITEFVSDGVDEYVDDKRQEKAEEAATSKTHLHHLLKLGNAGNGSAQDGASVARAADDEDYRDQLAAVEDGLVDYAGLAGSPDKALGRGKQEGDQADYGFGSGEHNAGYGGGSRSAIEGGRTAAGDGDGTVQRQRHDATGEAIEGGSVGEARRGPAPAAAVRFDDDIGGLRRRRKRKGKKKKTFMKLFILGAALKAKIELLLKILSFKLQLKFFAVALIGLLINIARFWIDFKKQPSPQKVIYYEHAQHQHHYDDHGDGDFGGYWKRSLHAVNDDEPYQGGHDRSERYDEPYPYRSPKYAPTGNHYAPQHADSHAMAYQQQRPY
ncbi:uncharacterized protein LOC131293876 [Anopheles ziemanni]|uniref:uncharacterized protein LOC131264643 n=1 Tax=Anopheles coustani TaxID=139045 RepID=UPI00265AB1B9|nr:uncharacterized protein LOC131264643 [Anopheles coustani]XP_058177909.1 uncharacterized protein LOC131293876 [Anopheles ziemanni]